MPLTLRSWTRRATGLLTAAAVCAGCLAPRPTLAQGSRTTRPELITAETEAVIAKGLTYLARKQNKEGHWNTPNYPTAMTSLAGLALLAGGNTPYEGRYADQVRRAADHLIRTANANADGLIAEPRERSHCMHGHGFAMLFLAEVYGMGVDQSRQRKIRKVLTAAVQLSGKSQSTAGGWLYHPDNNNDEGSVTVAQVHGLRACYNAGIVVPKIIIDNAAKYLQLCANPDGGICYSARSRGGSRPAITAAAVATLYHAGRYDHPVAKNALKYLDNTFGRNGYVAAARTGHRFYTTFYLSQAMYLASGDRWQRYFPTVRDDLVRSQVGDGSWQGPYGDVYATSICLVTLQLPYAHLPIFQR